MTLETVLAITTVAFALLVLWRARPLLPVAALPFSRAEDRKALKAAQQQIRDAGDQTSRASALVAAAELCASRKRFGSARGYLLRCARISPTQAVDAGVLMLAPAPRVLEAFLWRALSPEVPEEAGAEPSSLRAPDAATIRKTLVALAQLYEGPLRKRARGRAMQQIARSIVSSPSG
jgi:hypothetical protein